VSRVALRYACVQTATSSNHKRLHPLCGCDVDSVLLGFREAGVLDE
jgi:hypothetical protein